MYMMYKFNRPMASCIVGNKLHMPLAYQASEHSAHSCLSHDDEASAKYYGKVKYYVHLKNND